MAETRKANRGPAAGPENRRAIIAAAREIFASSGFQSPLSAVARRAGVGQGSLYRHFPTRTSLAVAVFEENVDALEEFVARTGRTLDELFDLVVEQALVSSAFIDMISADPTDPGVIHLGDRARHIAEGLLDREKAAGRVGGHVEPDDVLLAFSMIAGELARGDTTARRARARRAVALFHSAFTPR